MKIDLLLDVLTKLNFSSPAIPWDNLSMGWASPPDPPLLMAFSCKGLIFCCFLTLWLLAGGVGVALKEVGVWDPPDDMEEELEEAWRFGDVAM